MNDKNLSPKEQSKKNAALEACQSVKDGMLIGLGTGSTTTYFIHALAERYHTEKLNLSCVSSSIASSNLAAKLGIPLGDINSLTQIDLTVDGADEIDPSFNMIKGGGGALLREKLVASMSKQVLIIVDEKKCVKLLGRFPLAVEIIPFAYCSTIERLKKCGFEGTLRSTGQTPYLTDNQNYIFDIHLPELLSSPRETAQKLKEIVGVVETGLFFNLVSEVIIGYDDGHVERRDENGKYF